MHAKSELAPEVLVLIVFARFMIESLPDIIIARQASLGPTQSSPEAVQKTPNSLTDTKENRRRMFDGSTDAKESGRQNERSCADRAVKSNSSNQIRSRPRMPQWHPFNVFGGVKGSVLGKVAVVRNTRTSSEFPTTSCWITGYADFYTAWAVRLQFPSWLSSTVVHLQATRAQMGWQMNLDPICIRSREADIFRAAGNGNLKWIQELFESGQASPFDVDTDGKGIFWVSLRPHCSLQLTAQLVY